MNWLRVFAYSRNAAFDGNRILRQRVDVQPARAARDFIIRCANECVSPSTAALIWFSGALKMSVTGLGT